MVKIGLEIHQRLDTAHKLFCRCSTDGSERKVGEIRRKLHPVPSELGKVDVAAQFERLKDRTFVYNVYAGTVCEIDADEAPPLDVNADAVKTALMLCKMLEADVIDEIHVMRKLVLDGSAITSFQRTALVGMNGKVRLKEGAGEGAGSVKGAGQGKEGREIAIPTICLEEESCGVIGEVQRAETGQFRLDRLGIPLIEIATSADIKDGKEARAVAEQIGLMLRATGRVKRGIGTIRQDLNISIEGGARVEIKGIQELDLIEAAVDNEIMRQKGLIKLCERIKEIKEIHKEALKPFEVTKFFEKTECKFIREEIWHGQKVFAAKFPGMAGLFGTEIYPGYHYGAELNGYAKAVGAGGIIHSDEDMKRYGFMEEIKEMEKLLEKGPNDAWVIVVGSEELCKKVLQVVYNRAYLTFVPEETRHVLLNGRSEYMRPLPGAERMYPETDVKPIRIDITTLEGIKAPDFGEIEKRLRKILNEELAGKMLRSERLLLFEEIVAAGGNPVLAATTLEETLKSIRREGFDVSVIGDDKLKEIFIEYNAGLFVKAAIPEIIKALTKKPTASVKELVKDLGLEKISGFELRKLIRTTGAFTVQEMMQKHRLRVDAEEVKEAMAKPGKPAEGRKGKK